jgi:hypothetical protein
MDLTNCRITGIVFFYVLSSTLSLLLLVCLFLVLTQGRNKTVVTFIQNVCELIQSVADPVLYVFWFRECRLEILKMFV